MSASLKRSTLKLPRLRTKDELIKTCPEIARLLGAEVPNDDLAVAAPVRSSPPTFGKSRSLSAGSGRNGKSSSGMDTPRGSFEEFLTEEQQLQKELEEVKRERQVLLGSIAQVKQDAGTAGGEAQQADIKQLMKELELKKARLNEMREESRCKEDQLAKHKDETEDAHRLTPGQLSGEQAYIQHLKDEMKRIDEELIEAEAKNRLYYLLGERTRRDHMAMDQKVRVARDLKNDCRDDVVTLTANFNEVRAAKEAAEKDLSNSKKMFEEARMDWQKKLRERRKEVRELRKRQQKEKEKEQRRREKQLEKEKQERELQAKIKMENEAYQMQIQALAPRIEAMEAAWNRLRTISGADTPDDVISYWEGLKAKEESMRELVKLAEKREAAAKEEIAALLDNRSAMFEAANGVGEAGQSAEEQHTRIEDAERRMEIARAKFNKLRSICIGAQQGLKSVLERQMLALQELSPEQLRASAQKVDCKKGASKAKTSAANTASSPATGRQTQHSPEGKRRNTPPNAKLSIMSTPEQFDDAQDGRDGVTIEEKEENTIEDEQFFIDLPDLLNSVAERLNKILQSVEVDGARLPMLEEDENTDGPVGLSASEKMLMKGLDRHSWTGAPWMDTVTPDQSVMPTMKRKKGKKKDTQGQPDLHRILGYTGSDIEQDAPPSGSDEEGEAEGDAVMEREQIKHRALKHSHRGGVHHRMRSPGGVS